MASNMQWGRRLEAIMEVGMYMIDFVRRRESITVCTAKNLTVPGERRPTKTISNLPILLMAPTTTGLTHETTSTMINTDKVLQRGKRQRMTTTTRVPRPTVEIMVVCTMIDRIRETINIITSIDKATLGGSLQIVMTGIDELLLEAADLTTADPVQIITDTTRVTMTMMTITRDPLLEEAATRSDL